MTSIGQVSETLVSGETANISPFTAFKWHEWVLFRDTSVTYPNDMMVLGRDLGPAEDIGPAMTRTVVKANGKVVYRSTVRLFSPNKMADETMFNESLELVLGDSFKYEDFSNDPELESLGTPLFEPYEDDKGGQIPAPCDDNDEADPDTYDQYVDAEVVIPKGDAMMNAKVCGQKRQAEVTLLGKAHANPILNTRTFEL
jgi:hypothetical protein